MILMKKKNISSVSNVNYFCEFAAFNMITKDLLIVGGYNAISIINVNQYKLVKVIPVPYSNASYAFCKLNENMFLTGSEELRTIYQWKIKGDNIILIGKKNIFMIIQYILL